MPGALPGIPGLVAFGAVKFCGYAVAVGVLKHAQPVITANRFAIAGVRTGLGVLVGPVVTIGSTWALSLVQVSGSVVTAGFFAALFASSFFVWAAVIRLFSPPNTFAGSLLWRYSLFGAVWSLGLDFLGGALALIVPGKIAFC